MTRVLKLLQPRLAWKIKIYYQWHNVNFEQGRDSLLGLNRGV